MPNRRYIYLATLTGRTNFRDGKEYNISKSSVFATNELAEEWVDREIDKEYFTVDQADIEEYAVIESEEELN